MSYSSNPLLPKARKWAINLVLVNGLSVSQAARRAGVHRSTLWRWLRRWQELGLHGNNYLPTRSSRPHYHPKALSESVVARIVALRQEWQRCAQFIWYVLQREGIRVSLASVGRVLARAGLSSSWYGMQGKERRKRMPRPRVTAPGSFLQLDDIHFTDWRDKRKGRYYVYTLIDLKSRWTYAEYSPSISPADSVAFVTRAQKAAPFVFQLIQTDNGQEFSAAFEQELNNHGIVQRRIRLGKKNDNAHIERFNRTVQDECLGRWPLVASIPEKLKDYLEFYNHKRLHLSLQGRTPVEVLQRF
jgi:transposase InsO family protein